MNFDNGTVVLIGAGPGDPDLITIKAVEYLKKATVILSDRLANYEIIDRYCTDVKIITVGKNGLSGAKTEQNEINSLICQYANMGERVVRLKGGDVSIFSNIAAEIEALRIEKIPFTIIPGITAASGIAAFYQFPLTARLFTQSVRYLTLCQTKNWNVINWTELANSTDTKVFYMTGKHLFRLINRLISNGMPSTTPIAVFEKATLPTAKINIETLETGQKNWKKYKPASPSLIIIGNVLSYINFELNQQMELFYQLPENQFSTLN